MRIINFIKTQSRMRKYLLVVLFVLFTDQSFLAWDTTSSIGDNIGGIFPRALIFLVLAFLLTLNTTEDLVEVSSTKDPKNVESRTSIYKIIRFNRAVGGASIVLWLVFLFPIMMVNDSGKNSEYNILSQVSVFLSPLVIIPSFVSSKKFYSQLKLREALFVSFFCYWFLFSIIAFYLTFK